MLMKTTVDDDKQYKKELNLLVEELNKRKGEKNGCKKI